MASSRRPTREFAGAKEFQTMVVGAIKSVAGDEPFCR
jgi:hypothetical protein